jgi:hypothetical protein
MTRIADTATLIRNGANLADLLTLVRSTASETRPEIRPASPDGTPYTVWRRREHAYWNLDNWSRMISTYPLNGHAKHFTRAWDWNGGRVEAKPSGVVSINPATKQPFMVIRNIGPHDSLGGARRPDAKRTVPDMAVKVTFPDWVTLTPCN